MVFTLINGETWQVYKNHKQRVFPVNCVLCNKQYYIPMYRVKDNKIRLCCAKCRGKYYAESLRMDRLILSMPNYILHINDD